MKLYRTVLAEIGPQLGADDPLLWGMRYRVALKTMHLPSTPEAEVHEAIRELRQIMAWQEEHLATDDLQIYRTKFSLADGLIQEAKNKQGLPEAEELLRCCIANYEKKADDFDIIVGRTELMTAVFNQGRTVEALKLGRETCAYAVKKFGERHSLTGRVYGRLAKHCREAGRVDESIECGRRALDIYWHTVRPDYVKAKASLKALSQTLVNRGDLTGNLELLRTEVKVCDQQLGPGHEHTLLRVEDLLATLREMKLHEEAHTLGSSWLERVRLIEGPLPPEAAGLLVQHALTLLQMGRVAAAGTLLQELTALTAKITHELPALSRFLPLANSLLECGRPEEAGIIVRRLIVLCDQGQDEDSQVTAQVLIKAKNLQQQAEQAVEARKTAGR